MFDLSPIKLLLIAVVTTALIGPDKIPEVARTLGKAWRRIKGLQQRVETEVRELIPDLPDTANLARIARSPINLLNELADRQMAGAEEPTPEDVADSTSDTDTPTILTSTLRKPIVNPPTWQPPAGPFDPSHN